MSELITELTYQLQLWTANLELTTFLMRKLVVWLFVVVLVFIGVRKLT